VKLGHSGSFRVRVGIETSLVTDSETETAFMATVPSSLDGTIAVEATVPRNATVPS